MLHTFEAVLKGNRLEWTNDAPKESDRPVKVYVTLLEEDSSLNTDIRRQKIGEIFQKLAATNVFAREPTELEKQQYHRMMELSDIARKRYLQAGGDPRRAADDKYMTSEEKKEFLELGRIIFGVQIRNGEGKRQSVSS